MGTPWKIKLTIHAPTGSRADIEAQISAATKDTIMAALDAEFKGEPMHANALLRQALEALEDVDQIDTATESVVIDVGSVIAAIRQRLGVDP